MRYQRLADGRGGARDASLPKGHSAGVQIGGGVLGGWRFPDEAKNLGFLR